MEHEDYILTLNIKQGDLFSYAGKFFIYLYKDDKNAWKHFMFNIQSSKIEAYSGILKEGTTVIMRSNEIL